jgi:hypothetical protein
MGPRHAPAVPRRLGQLGCSRPKRSGIGRPTARGQYSSDRVEHEATLRAAGRDLRQLIKARWGMHVGSDIAAPSPCPSQRLKVLRDSRQVVRAASETLDLSDLPHSARDLCRSGQRTQESKRAKKQDGVTPPHTATSRGGRARDYHIRTSARTRREWLPGRATPLHISQ